MSGTITINANDLINATYNQLYNKLYPQLKSQITKEPEVAQQPYSYIIWTDGTNYYAKNGQTGQIEFSGTDACKVIQQAINALPNYYSGVIHIKAGTYVCRSLINVPSGDIHFEIRGEGLHNTILSFETNETFDQLRGAITVISNDFYNDRPFGLSTAPVSGLGVSAFLGIRDLTLWVKDPNLNGIVLSKIPRLIIQNVRIKGYYTDTVPPFTPNTAGLYVYLSFNSEINIIENLITTGFTTGINIFLDHAILIGVQSARVRVGMKLNGYDVVAIRPHVYLVHEVAYELVGKGTGITLICPKAEGPTSSYAVVFKIPSDQTPIANIYGLTTYGTFASLINTPYQNIRFYGLGWQTSGVATIPTGSTRVTISHGLVTTPNKVLITPLAQPPGKLWVENITSTSFDIVTDTAPTTNLNIAWNAEV
jgi:hypothetical protein